MALMDMRLAGCMHARTFMARMGMNEYIYSIVGEHAFVAWGDTSTSWMVYLALSWLL